MTRETQNVLAFAAPFAAWIGLQTVLPATAWAYAVRAAAAAAALLAASGRLRRLCAAGASAAPLLPRALWGLAGGLLVLALWILPESSAFYRTWCVWPIGVPPAATAEPSPYDPAVCGWTLTVAKLVGSAFVIAPAEELFFRSFLYRRLQRRDFLSVPPSRFDPSAFAWTVCLFSLEHDRLLAAALCGVVYGLLALRHGLLAAVVAHVTTNLLLAVYVIATGRWGFW